MFTSTPLQAVTYLLGVSLFSIAFLVFLNSSISFVVTDLIQKTQGVGDAVGTLGFADELVALVACPAWGMISDRVGVRTVCVTGYAIIGLALILFVQAKNVYPQLLLFRLVFSLGGSATATMVTAILPMMVSHQSGRAGFTSSGPSQHSNRSAISPMNRDHTYTPTARNDQDSEVLSVSDIGSIKPFPTRVAGLVGLCTGCGALVALSLFLPLPSYFRNHGVLPGTAVQYSFYIVGAVSLGVAIFCFFGLRNLGEKDEKGWRASTSSESFSGAKPPLYRPKFTFVGPIFRCFALGYEHPGFCLSYVGGFVARASSVGITLFIPLYVNAYYAESGMCNEPVEDPHKNIKHCQYAYILAAKLTGVSQLAALVFAPIFGYLADKYRRFNIPLLAAACIGIIGYIAMAFLNNPDPQAPGGTAWIFLIASLLGISQIGAIVCSLGLLGHSILELTANSDSNGASPISDELDQESRQLLSDDEPKPIPYENLTGSIAGVYSLAGGAGILLLTKIGGIMFDRVSHVAPFYLLALINGFLLLVGMGCGILELRRNA